MSSLLKCRRALVAENLFLRKQLAFYREHSGSAASSHCLGNGDGTLQSETIYSTGYNPVFVAAVDVNGDGAPDLLTANNLVDSIGVLLANGSGYLPHVDYTVTKPVRLAFADFNRDGKVDMVTADSSGSSRVSLLNWNGVGLTLTVVRTASPTSVRSD